MWKRFAAHIDEASWRYGRQRQPGEPREETWRCLGDFECGPWVYIIERPADLEVRPHNHNEDELVYILEGGLSFDGDWYGPGSVLRFRRTGWWGGWRRRRVGRRGPSTARRGPRPARGST